MSLADFVWGWSLISFRLARGHEMEVLREGKVEMDYEIFLWNRQKPKRK